MVANHVYVAHLILCKGLIILNLNNKCRAVCYAFVALTLSITVVVGSLGEDDHRLHRAVVARSPSQQCEDMRLLINFCLNMLSFIKLHQPAHRSSQSGLQRPIWPALFKDARETSQFIFRWDQAPFRHVDSGVPLQALESVSRSPPAHYPLSC